MKKILAMALGGVAAVLTPLVAMSPDLADACGQKLLRRGGGGGCSGGSCGVQPQFVSRTPTLASIQPRQVPQEREEIRPPLVFVGKKDHDWYMARLPEGVLTSAERERAIFYDRSNTPQAYQDFRGALPSVHSIYNNVSARQGEPFGNANREFPWNTGGLDRSSNGSDFKVLVLPERRDGTLQPIVGWWERLPGDRFDSMVGKYPVGTKVCEVLLVNDGERTRPFEVRVLEKIRDGVTTDFNKFWARKYFRPVRDCDHLWELTKNDPYHAKLERHYQDEFWRDRLQDSHPVGVFNAVALLDTIPAMDKRLAARLLEQPFQDVTDVPWITGRKSGTKGFAPAPSGTSFVADHFQGAFIHSNNCTMCHTSVLKHADDFDRGRDWYGRVRGFDGIFSLCLADEASVARTGTPRQALWSRKLVAAGILVGPR